MNKNKARTLKNQRNVSRLRNNESGTQFANVNPANNILMAANHKLISDMMQNNKMDEINMILNAQ